MKSNLSSDIGITAFLVAIIGLFFATSPLLAADYTYTEIIPPNWVWSSCRAAINDSGVVAGWGYDGTSWKAFTYYQGTYQIITQAGWHAIYPLSMNNNGTIVGEAQPAGSLAFRAVIYSEGVLTDLTPTGVSQARLVDINDNGDMIGNILDSDSIGFLYSDGVYTQLLPPGWTGSIVNAISNDGTVIGRNLPDDKQFLYKNGTYTIIDSTGEFMGINDNGEVVGIVPMVTGGSYTPKSFIYSNGEFTTGIAPPGWLTAYLLDINNSGVAAGYGWDPVIDNEVGFTYDHGTYTTFIPPGMLYVHVTAINKNGIILGYGVYPGDIIKVFTATPGVVNSVDLIETTVSDPPLSSTAGSSFAVTDTVENQGSTSAGASVTSYYLSLDAIRGSGDILLTGSRAVPSLGINETNEGILTVTIPNGTGPGSYYLLACADDTNVVVESDENNNCIASVSQVVIIPPVNPSGITLQSPVDGTVFDSCSLIATHQPTFNWTASRAFSGLSIQFSTSPTDFKTRGVLISKVALRATSVSWTPTIALWKAILIASNNKGNIRDIYWKVVGTLPDRTTVESEVRSFGIGPPQPVTINAPAEGATLPFAPLPSFDMNTSCNVKFRLEFSPSDAFSDPKTVRGFVFILKDPTLQPTLQKTLTPGQWIVVKRLLVPRGYFRIKAWDAIGRETISGVRSFNIQSMLIGNWNVTGIVTTTVALAGYLPATRSGAARDVFTFSEDGSFQMTDMAGTYTEQGPTFTVNLSPADIELYFEQELGASLGAPVDVTVTGVSFKGTENWTAGTIAGIMTMSMGISSLSWHGTVKVAVTFRGVRSPVQGLSLSALEASSSQPSQSLIRVIGGGINNSIQGIKGGGQ